jgi:hypothetical protein
MPGILSFKHARIAADFTVWAAQVATNLAKAWPVARRIEYYSTAARPDCLSFEIQA